MIHLIFFLVHKVEFYQVVEMGLGPWHFVGSLYSTSTWLVKRSLTMLFSRLNNSGLFYPLTGLVGQSLNYPCGSVINLSSVPFQMGNLGQTDTLRAMSNAKITSGFLRVPVLFIIKLYLQNKTTPNPIKCLTALQIKWLPVYLFS